MKPGRDYLCRCVCHRAISRRSFPQTQSEIILLGWQFHQHASCVHTYTHRITSTSCNQVVQALPQCWRLIWKTKGSQTQPRGGSHESRSLHSRWMMMRPPLALRQRCFVRIIFSLTSKSGNTEVTPLLSNQDNMHCSPYSESTGVLSSINLTKSIASIRSRWWLRLSPTITKSIANPLWVSTENLRGITSFSSVVCERHSVQQTQSLLAWSCKLGAKSICNAQNFKPRSTVWHAHNCSRSEFQSERWGYWLHPF